MKGKEENQLNEEELEKKIQGIEEEIIHKKQIPEVEMNKINKKVFENIVIADLVMIFFYFISLGSLNIESNVFVMDLKVFSMGLVIFSILLFERSYKKDSGNLCVHGIEALVLAIFMLFTPFIYATYFHKFHLIVSAVSFLSAIYYVGKTIYLYLKMKRNYYAKKNDINEIIKK